MKKKRINGCEIVDRVIFALNKAVCFKCGYVYIGTKDEINCVGCGKKMKTEFVATSTVVTGQWNKIATEFDEK